MVALRKMLEAVSLAVTIREEWLLLSFSLPWTQNYIGNVVPGFFSTRQQWSWEGWWHCWIDHRSSNPHGPWCSQHPAASYWEPVRPILQCILFYSLIIFYKFLQYVHLCPMLASEDENMNIPPSWPWKETQTRDHAYFSRNFFFLRGESLCPSNCLLLVAEI